MWENISIRIFADAINESNPRVIEDSRARKLANDLKRCAYYETCATYGLNVERVFQDGESVPSPETVFVHHQIFAACQKICVGRGGSSRPTTPNHFAGRTYPSYVASPTNTNGYTNTGMMSGLPGPPHSPGSGYHQVPSPAHLQPHQNTFGKVSHRPRASKQFRRTEKCPDSKWVSSGLSGGNSFNFSDVSQ